jgi:hypothetical protein
MGISKYPRPGQRIAPETLREILDVPVPAELSGQTPERYETLADLDETVWRHMPATKCRALAKFVLRQVRWGLPRALQAVRTKTLPQFHQPTPVSALEVDVRTSNCLNNCIELRVGSNLQFLNDLTVGDLLNWRNLGACSLVDLLVALESAAAKSDRFQRQQLRIDNAIGGGSIPATELPSEFRVEISHFPRRSERIAPRTLFHILDVPTKGRHMDGVKLRDLDESTWERFEYETCHKLVLEVVDRVRRVRGILCSQLGNRRLPIPRTKGRLAVLHLQTRTFRCLREAGLLENPARMAEATFRDLFEIPGFGDTCLVDLLSTLEAQTVTDHRTR